MNKRFKKPSHTIYGCKYHIVMCPKYRLRIFTDEIAEYTKQQIMQYVKWHEKREKEIENKQLNMFK